MRCEAVAPALASLDEQEVLQRLRAALAQGAHRSGVVYNVRACWCGLRRRARPATHSTAAHRRQTI